MNTNDTTKHNKYRRGPNRRDARRRRYLLRTPADRHTISVSIRKNQKIERRKKKKKFRNLARQAPTLYGDYTFPKTHTDRSRTTTIPNAASNALLTALATLAADTLVALLVELRRRIDSQRQTNTRRSRRSRTTRTTMRQQR